MRLAFGARINGLKPEALLGLVIASELCTRWNFDMGMLEIVAVVNGEHSNDGHYAGMAFDIRLPHTIDADVLPRFADELVLMLGEEFFVFLRPDRVIHVGFVPKRQS